jgi:hypothetical protein
VASYRKKPAAEAPEHIPEIKHDGQPIEPLAVGHAEPDDDETPVETVERAVAQAEQDAMKADETAQALRKQIEQLRLSERLQRQRHAAMAQAQRPVSPEEKLASWKSAGMPPGEEEFLRNNIDLVANDRLTAVAAAEASRLHQRGTEAYMRAVRKNFDRLMAQGAAQPTPQFFAVPPAPEPPGPGAYVSAPVSRETPTGAYREPSPSQVRLSAEERQIARASGISEVEYARNRLRLEREKRTGQRQ